MLSVILLILKIIGMVILLLLSILLVLILVVLFIPIRYRVKVEHGDFFVLDGCVSWVLHLIHAKIYQSGNNRRIWVRVFGIIIYDSLRPPKHRRKTSKSKIKAAKAKVEEASETNYKQKTDTENETDGIVKDEIVKGGIAKTKIGVKDLIKESIQKEEAESEYIKSDGIFSKAYKKIKARIINFIQKTKDKLKELIQKFINIKNKFSLIHNFINDDINKEGFRFTYGSLKNLIKHVLPRKVKSRLIFGTGDPCSTGQALGVFGILYSIYGDSLQITPDFENKVFKGNHYVRGRIRIWTILIIVIKLLLDKRFKELKMNYQLLKEAL